MNPVEDYLETVERQLAELTEQGAHRRVRAPSLRRGRAPSLRRGRAPSLRREVLVAIPAVAVTLAVVAIVLLNASPARHVGAPARTAVTSASPSPPSRNPSGTGLPGAFAPASFTAISEREWWLLGTGSCSGQPCRAIVHTTNGGQTFTQIRRAPGSDVQQLRFADASDGFAFDPGLWVTHDAGAHWHRAQLSGRVAELATSGGFVYALVLTGHGGTGVVARAPVGGDAWTMLLGTVGAVGGLWAHGADVLVEQRAPGQNGDALSVSHDDGQSFSRFAAPASIVCRFEEPAPPVVWAHCATGMMSGTWRSAHGGASFAGAGTPAAPHGPELPNSAVFGAASASTAVVGFDRLYRTTDAGASYQRVDAPSGFVWEYVGFTDPTHGVAIGYPATARSSAAQLYYTTDAGASYHAVPIR